jgi:hypothetical protein
MDVLNGGETFVVSDGKLELPAVPARWARVLRLE